MQVTLNKNSWHFRYYNMVIGDNAPKSLCPYFWSMVALIVVSPILFPVVGIIKLMSMYSNWRDLRPSVKKPKEEVKTIEELSKEHKEKWDKEMKRMKIMDKAGKIFITLLLMFAVIILIIGLYKVSQKIGWFEFFELIFAIIGFIGTFLLIVYFWLENEWGDKIVNKITNLSIVKITKAMIVGTYNKACPMIKWQDEISVETTK